MRPIDADSPKATFEEWRMMDRDEMVSRLDFMSQYFAARGGMAVGDGKLLLMACMKAASEAAALVKAQEPRVMTYGEMMKAEICFLEVKGIEEIDPFIRYEVDDKSYWSSPYTNNEDNPFEMLAEQEEYLINARCWTSRPTDEQRKAVAWNA